MPVIQGSGRIRLFPVRLDREDAQGIQPGNKPESRVDFVPVYVAGGHRLIYPAAPRAGIQLEQFV